MLRVFYSFLSVLLLVGCSSTVDYRGKSLESDQLAKIKVNKHREEDVVSLIGSPTNTNLYGPKKWYYVYKKTAKTSFFAPSVLDEQLVTITFNDQGVVTNVTQTTPDGRVIDPVGRKTPTLGEDRPILHQVFGNFGRFAKKAEPTKQ